MIEQRFDDVYYDLVVDAYEVFHPQASSQEIDFYSTFIQKQPGRVLELMCGTGRILLPLLHQGFTVDGTDSSIQMLARCRAKAHAQGMTVNLYEQLAHELSLPNQYQTILLTYSSFSLLSDRNEALETLNRVYDHLIEGGQLLLDMEIPWVDSSIPAGCWHLSRQGSLPDGRTIQVSRAAKIDPLQQLEVVQVRYDVYDQKVLTQTLLTPMRMRYYGLYELMLLLEKAGFSTINTFGQLQHRPVQESDRLITFQCLK